MDIGLLEFPVLWQAYGGEIIETQKLYNQKSSFGLETVNDYSGWIMVSTHEEAFIAKQW